ncbi:MAG: flavodoxin family protein [Succinivibrio sp.]
MKALIVVSSVTGNTLKVAKAVQSALSCDLARIEDILDTDNFDTENYDTLIVGFWLDSGHIDNKSLEFIPTVKNKKVVLFGTLGGDPQGKGAAMMMDRTVSMLDKSNELLGHFWIQGKISDDVISLMYSHHPELKDNKAHQERIKRASTHPDENDLKKAQELVKSFLGE